MASDYDPIKQLSQINAAKPSNSEEARNVAAAIRQLKGFVKYFLAKVLNDDGTLKAGTVSSSDGLGDGVVRGSTANSAGEQQEVLQGTISTPDLRDLAVSAGKLAEDAVEEAKIKALAVTAGKLAADAVETAKVKDLNITTDKLAALAVTAAKLATDAVEEPKIKNAAVTNGKIADLAVTPAKISNIGLAKLLVGDGTSAQAGAVGGALTATWNDTLKQIVFALATASATGNLAYARVVEKKATTTDAGASVAGTYTARPSWFIESDSLGLVVGTTGAKLVFAAAGVYIVHIMCPGYSCGLHRIKLRKTTATAADKLIGSGVEAGPGVQNMASLEGVVVTAAANEEYEIQHWCEKTHTKGLGRAVGDTLDEIYGRIEILKV